MSSRRSPAVSRGAVNSVASSTAAAATTTTTTTTTTTPLSSSNGNNSRYNPKKDDPSSPSKARRRSCLDYGRLCVLRQRSRTSLFWKRFLFTTTVVFLSTYTLLSRLYQQPSGLQHDERSYFHSSFSSSSLRIRNNNNEQQQPPQERILYQPIETNTNPVDISRRLHQSQLLTPKPLMMAFLWQEEEEEETKQEEDSSNNSNEQDHHHHHHHHHQDAPKMAHNFRNKQVDSKQRNRVQGQNLPQVERIPHADPSLQRIYNLLKKNAQEQEDSNHNSNDKENDKENDNDNSKLQEHPHHHHHHQALTFSTHNIQWTFDNNLLEDAVEELGHGVEVQEDIRDNSRDYSKGKPDDPPRGCEPQYEWQLTSFPNCNTLHELDLQQRVVTDVLPDEPEGVLLASGGYRDVWFVEQNHVQSEPFALKTLLYEHKYTERNIERHRRDAVATDRLTGSPYALNLYGYCSNSGIYEYANGGSLEDAVDDEEDYGTWNASTKFKYAHQVAQAIADVHNIDKEGFPSMSHTDISMSQFVSTNDGVDYQINDFNRARFVYRRKNNPNELCPFDVASNKGKFRSPEEYAYEPETAKIDVYSMGNIFYVLLTGKYPFADAHKNDAKEYVKKGRRPPIPKNYLSSTDPFEHAMVEAIQRCWVQDPNKRATSRQIEQYFSGILKQHKKQQVAGHNTKRAVEAAKQKLS